MSIAKFPHVQNLYISQILAALGYIVHFIDKKTFIGFISDTKIDLIF